MKKVYIEFVLLDNFLMDFIILFFAMRLSEKRAKFSRVSAGAALGAVYSALAFAIPLLGKFVFKCIGLAIMCLPLGVRPAKRYFSRCGLALLCSFLFGGCILFIMLASNAPLHSAYLGLPILRYILIGLAAGIVLLELYCRTPRPKPGAEYFIHAEFSGVCMNLRGFLDTGNLLQSPGGLCVIIMAQNAASQELLAKLALLELPAFPCLAASGQTELSGFLPDKLIITTGGKSYAAKAYIALADMPFPGQYTALLGSNLKLFPL